MQEIIEYELGQIVTIDFSTHAANGQPVAPSAAYSSNAVDFRIYKEDSATQKATLNGLACISPFDSIVGKHVITIDTANSTGDSGFWESGKNYRVELHTVKTIDGVEQKGVVVGRFKLTPSTLTATTLRAALGMSAANLDTQLSGLPAAIEAAILNEGDATALLAAISAKVEEFLINDGDATATLSAIATACATAILSTPANKLATNGSGEVTAANFIAAPTVADIADGVWDELLAGHATSGSSGKILTDLSTGSIDLSALATLVAAALAQIRLSVQQQLTLTSGSDLRVIQGDDYTRAGSKIVIELDTSAMIDPNIDLSPYKFVICGRSGSSLIAVRMPIGGSPGSHTVEFDPPSSLTETWATGSYDLLYRIEWDVDEFTTLNETGILRVDPFDIEPSDIVDL